MISSGYTNEWDFINYLNNKRYRALHPLMQEVIDYLYPYIKPDTIIYASKYGKYAKTDIVVEVAGIKKGISLKSGYKNSVHIEPIKRFSNFLKKHNITDEDIDLLLRYLYSDGTNNNTGTTRITNSEYIMQYPTKTAEINSAMQKLSQKLIRRFLVETDIKYTVPPDIFIHGEVNDFIWASREEVEEYLENESVDSTSVHIGKLYIQNWNKNIKRNEMYEYCREYIQVKWFSMYDDMISIMMKRHYTK